MFLSISSESKLSRYFRGKSVWAFWMPFCTPDGTLGEQSGRKAFTPCHNSTQSMYSKNETWYSELKPDRTTGAFLIREIAVASWRIFFRSYTKGENFRAVCDVCRSNKYGIKCLCSRPFLSELGLSSILATFKMHMAQSLSIESYPWCAHYIPFTAGRFSNLNFWTFIRYRLISTHSVFWVIPSATSLIHNAVPGGALSGGFTALAYGP